MEKRCVMHGMGPSVFPPPLPSPLFASSLRIFFEHLHHADSRGELNTLCCTVLYCTVLYRTYSRNSVLRVPTRPCCRTIYNTEIFLVLVLVSYYNQLAGC